MKTQRYGFVSRTTRLITIGTLVALACVPPIFSQESTDSVIEANEAIARSAGRLLPAALDLAPGSDTVSVAVGTITVDGRTPRLASSLSALVTDEMFARASALRAGRGVDVLAAGPLAGGSTLLLNVTGMVGETEAAFVLQIVDRSSGAIRASARQSITLSPAVVAALQPTVQEGGVTGVSDPNDVSDNPDYAQLVALDSVVSGGQLSVEGDHDWFYFQVSGIPLDVEGIPAVTAYTTGSTDTYIEVYGPGTYTMLMNENDDGGDNTNARLSFAVENNQAYWVLVRGFADSSTGSYNLHLETSMIEPDHYEPNDDAGSAVSIDPTAGDIFASIRPTGDADWYSIDMASLAVGSDPNAELRLAIETVGAIDTVMTVYDRYNNQLAYNDDGGVDGNARALVPFDAEGPLLVEVRGYGDWVEGDYQLIATTVEVVIDEYEPDDSQRQARPVEINGQPQLRTFSSETDVDWVLLEVDSEAFPTGASLRMYTDGEVDTYMVLYDQFGSELSRSDDDGFGFNAMIDQRLAPGSYYVELYPLYLEGMDGEYTFAVDEH